MEYEDRYVIGECPHCLKDVYYHDDFIVMDDRVQHRMCNEDYYINLEEPCLNQSPSLNLR